MCARSGLNWMSIYDVLKVFYRVLGLYAQDNMRQHVYSCFNILDDQELPFNQPFYPEYSDSTPIFQNDNRKVYRAG